MDAYFGHSRWAGCQIGRRAEESVLVAGTIGPIGTVNNQSRICLMALFMIYGNCFMGSQYLVMSVPLGSSCARRTTYLLYIHLALAAL
jgi:hypothetical protein